VALLVSNTDLTLITLFNLQFFSQTKNATKSVWEMLCRERDLQRNRPKNRKIGETKNAEINNIVYKELYSGPKRVNERLENEISKIEKSRVQCI
jgi:hypothetical protein